MEWELSIARAIDEDVDVILSQTIGGYDQNLWHLLGNQDDPKVKHAGDVRDEMEHKHEDKVGPSYLQVYKHKGGSYQDEQMSVVNNARKVGQQHDKSQNSQGSVAWEGDAFSQLMGKEKHGRIRGLGLGPTPTEILGMPITWHSEEVHKLQEKVDSMQGIITNLQASDSAKSFKVKELEDRLACLEGLFNKPDGPSKQQEAPKNLHRNPTIVFEKFQELSFC
ncbi:hypothetical protein Ancab_000620 [Ancistrocladus abbreviatus]